MDHKKVDCQELMRGAVMAPAPTTLRIMDGRESRVDVLVVRSRALYLHAEGIRVPSVDIAGMCCIHFLHALNNCVYDCMFVCEKLYDCIHFLHAVSNLLLEMFKLSHHNQI